MGRKTNVWIFQAEISHEKPWTCLWKGNLKRETESLSIAAETNSIRTTFIKAKIDKMWQNNKCRLCGDKNETINYIKDECSKLVQNEYKTSHDWVGMLIHRGMCKMLKFDHTTKWYMHKPEAVPKNGRHKIFCDSETQTDHLILARRPDMVIIN